MIIVCDLCVPVDRVSQQRDHFFTHAVAPRSTFVMTETELAAAFKKQEQERAKFEAAMKKRKTTLNICIVKQYFSVSRLSVVVRRVILCSHFVRGVENVDGSVCHNSPGAETVDPALLY